jgi:hypothetical protein
VNRAIKIIAVLLIGLTTSCGEENNISIRTDDDIAGALVSSSGGFSGFVDVDSSTSDDHIPQVAFDGTNYLVVYEESVTGTDHDIIGALVDPTGAVLSYIEIDVTGNDDRAPRVAFDGTNYLVVYEETVTSTNHDIIGARVDPNPNAVVPVLGYVNIDVSTNDDFAPAVAFDGTNYLVVYQETFTSTDHDIIGAQVSKTGTVLVGSPIVINGSSNDDLAPAVAFDTANFNYLVVYEDGSGSNHDIVGTLVDTTGAPGIPFVIGNASNDLLAPAVAFDGSNYLVVYQETFSSTDHDIIGAQVSKTGTVLVGSPFEINMTLNDDVAPSIAFNGTYYLVAYQETFTSADHDIIGNQVTPAGFVGLERDIDTSQFDDIAPAVASDGSNYFVVYEDVF